MKWLIFFYSVPSRPVSSRMKIWRRLIKAGSLPFKGGAYVLPYSEEYYEFCQWLVSEVEMLKGEAAFIGSEKIENAKDSEIVASFNKQREKDYMEIEKARETVEIKMQSVKKGSGGQIKKTYDAFNRLTKDFESVQKIDFFSSKTGAALKKKLETLRTELAGIDISYTSMQSRAITPKRALDYQGKTWITRKKPFIDRMASAWLIKKFIDKNAIFNFADEKTIKHQVANTVTFDIVGGDFTHIGDMCTFEVIAKAFNLADKKIRKTAAIVHELDIKDDKYKTAEAKGMEEILVGIRKTAMNDSDALEKGMMIFDMFYESMA